MRKSWHAVLVAIVVLSGCASSRARTADAAPGAEPTPRPFALPAPEAFALPNGLSGMVVRRAHLPIVTVRAVVRAGSVDDTAGKAGLAELTGDLLKRGAGSRSAPALAEAIDATGGSLEVVTGQDATTVTLTVLRRDLARGLDLLADVLTRPRLDAKELASLVAEARAALEAALDDGDEVADLAIERVALAGHPYGRPPSRKALGAMKQADVRAFYDRHYGPDRTTVYVVGDVDARTAGTELERAFRGWRRAKSAAPAAARRLDAVEPMPPAPVAPTKPTVWLVDMDVTQSFVRLGAPGPARRDPGRPALSVMNFVLGGDFTSRLNQVIRDKEGLAYGASSRYEAWRAGGVFKARLNTRTETTRRAVNRLRAILGDVREAPLTADELDSARAHLAGAFPLRFETNADVARELADVALYGLPADEIAGYRARVRAVDAAAVQAVARRWVPGDAWHLVVVGRAAAIAPQLTGLGEVRRLSRASLVD